MTDFGKGYRRASERVNALYREFAEEDRRQTSEDYRALLQLPAFRRVLSGILKRGRLFGSLAWDGSDTNDVMKRIGMRETAVDIYAAANLADGKMVLLAIEERNELERRRKMRTDAARNETEGNDE